MQSKKCREPECTKYAKRGGVCVRHGAKVEPKRCSKNGCTNIVVRGGVCVRHGAEVKRCSSEGCTNQAQIGGVCVRHGAKVEYKRCSSEGCSKFAKRGGVCVRHGGTVKRCSSEGCSNIVVRGGVCMRHGATVKRCSSEGCSNQVVRGGVCIRHGATVKRCSSEGCSNKAWRGGVCKRHDGSRKRKSPSPPVVLSDEALRTKRLRPSSTRSKRARSASPPEISDEDYRDDPGKESSDIDQVTSAKRRKTNGEKAAAETLLSFASQSTSVDVNDSTDYEYSFSIGAAAENEPQDTVVHSAEITLESLPDDIWRDSSSFSSSPCISNFLTIEEIKNVRLVCKPLHRLLHVEGAWLRVGAFPWGSMKIFGCLERIKEFFHRPRIEIAGKFLHDCRNSFFWWLFTAANCLRGVKHLTLTGPADYPVLNSLGDMPKLMTLCIKDCRPRYMTSDMELSSDYEPQDFHSIKNVEVVELIRSSLPNGFLGDLMRAISTLKGLKLRGCDARNIEDGNWDDLAQVLSNLPNLEVFKFVPKHVFAPSASVRPTEEEANRLGYSLYSPDDEEIDNHSRLSNQILDSVCRNRSRLKSLSMRNVELVDGEGIHPLKRLKYIENLCLCALSSFEGDDLEILNGIKTLRILTLTHCRLIEGCLGELTGLTELEELSLIATSLDDNDFDSLVGFYKLRVLNINGDIHNNCDLSKLRRLANLRHLSLQIFNTQMYRPIGRRRQRTVLPNMAEQVNGLVSLESLCLRMRFRRQWYENNFDVVEPFVPTHPDEESTLNFSVGTGMDESIMDDVSSSDEAQEVQPVVEPSLLNFSGLRNLRSLSINDSVLTDDVVESLSGSLTHLQDLSLWDCDTLSKSSISQLSKMKWLKKLLLHRFNALTEGTLKTLAKLDSIKELEFYLCMKICKAKIGNSLGKMKELEKLTISPYFLEKPVHLTHIKLVKDKSTENAEKRVKHLLQKIQSKGLF